MNCMRRDPQSTYRWLRRALHKGKPFVAWILSTVACILCGAHVCAQGDVSNEYQVKAAFLYHFAQFVEWPAETFRDGDSPITYCVVGEDPFNGALDASLKGKLSGTRPLRVKHLTQPNEAQGCQVLFIGGDNKKSIITVLATMDGRHTLTVGDAEHFVQDGGMIGFCLEDQKIRFEINLSAAEHARLKISARLLALARTVIGGPKGT